MSNWQLVFALVYLTGAIGQAMFYSVRLSQLLAMNYGTVWAWKCVLGVVLWPINFTISALGNLFEGV